MAPRRRNNTDGERPSALPGWTAACLSSALFASTVGDAQAQNIEDEDLLLRGIVGGEGVVTAEDRAGALRQAETVDARGADGEGLADTRITTGAVQPVQTAGELNGRQTTVDDQSNLVFDPEPFGLIGIRIGSFILRPSVTQQIAHDIEQDDSSRTERTYSRTVLRGELESDWSRHQLRIYGEQVIDKTISGDGPEDPQTLANMDLRLDLSDNTTANLEVDYEFGRESQSDANAVADAFAQSDVHDFAASASLTHVFGSWLGTATIEGGRSTFGDAQLSDGTIVTQSDRNENDYTVTLRGGINMGSANLPFVEGDYGQIIYDDTLDQNGFARSSRTYGIRAGTAFDFGEKLNGEIAVGYAQRDIDDPRLAPIKGLTIDGFTNWSPRRGTNVVLGLSTSLEDSTTADESGSIYYAATTEVTHQLRDNLSANLSTLIGWRDYMEQLGDQTVYGVGAGFTWWVNRRFGFEGGIAYEKTVTHGGGDSDEFFAGVGVTLRP